MNREPVDSEGTTRVLLWGDSLTEGKPGISFAEILSESHPRLIFDNRGRGGDTVSSLLGRLRVESSPPARLKADLAVLWIGVNDLFAQILPGYALLKTAWGQPPSRDPSSFIEDFRFILDLLKDHARRIVVMPPLFVGEDPGTELNRRIKEWGDMMAEETSRTENCRFVDIRKSLPLDADSPSRFLPVNPWAKIADVMNTTAADYYDSASERRGLLWTFDGVHLNSKGARVVERVLASIISDEGL